MEKEKIDPEIESDEPELGYIIIDLTTVDEDEEMKEEDDKPPWWVRINGKDFGFKANIPLKHHCKVKEDDILVHKKMVEGEKFPRITYFMVVFDKGKMMGGKPTPLTNKDIKSYMIDFLINFVKKNNKLPYACVVDEFFKNGNVKIKYTPSKWDTFSLDITIKRGKRHDIPNLQEFFMGLVETKQNPATSGGNTIRRRK